MEDAEAGALRATWAHLEQWWPGKWQEFVWSAGPMHDQRPNFRVLRRQPKREQDPWVYASAGSSLLRMEDGTGHEFFVCSIQENALHVELVTMVAHYAAFGQHDGVHQGHTLNIGRPWVSGSACDHVYISTPHLMPRDFATFRHAVGSTHMLWLIPITAAENTWRHEHGQEAFEQLMETSKLDTYDPFRRSLI